MAQQSGPAHPIPTVGEEVLYHSYGKWISAEISAVLPDGDIMLHYVTTDEMVRQRSKHGRHLYGWVTYEEAAAGATREVTAADA